VGLNDILRRIDRWMQSLESGGAAIGLYARFERIIGLVLSICVSFVILLAILHLVQGLVVTFAAGLHEFDYRVFQGLFEMILTVLIALEFNHSLAEVVKGKGSLVQVKTVVLIGILVVVRKFILIEIDTASAVVLFGLSAAILGLGIVYWLVVDVDRRASQAAEQAKTES